MAECCVIVLFSKENLSMSPLSVTRQYMLAASVPALQGQELCPLLSQMDQAESKILAQEEKMLGNLLKEVDKDLSISNIFFQTLSIGIGPSGLTGAVLYARITNDVPGPALIGWNEERTRNLGSYHTVREAQRTANLRRGGRTAIISSQVSMLTFLFVRFANAQGKKHDITKRFTAEINTQRRLRLIAKVAHLEEGQSQAQAREKEQLVRSKDYFTQTHLGMNIPITNNIIVTHR